MKLKHLPPMLLGSMLYAAAYTQPTIEHQRTIGGSDYDYFTCMYLTKDGGFIAGGYSSSDISYAKTENSRGIYDYWVVKVDSTGNIQWDKTIGGNDYDELFSILQTSDGGYLLGGWSWSNISGEKTQNSRGDGDYWVVKLDSTGKIQWDKTIGGNNDDALYQIKETSDGGYILGGSSWSDISGEKTENSRGLWDYWVVKLDKRGKILWDKTIGGTLGDYLTSLQQTSDGGYILGGYSNSTISGEKTQSNRGSYDYWIVKLDSLREIQWDKTIGGRNYDGSFSLEQTNDNGYIVGGYSWSDISGEKTENSRGVSDCWVVKLDSAGTIKWDKTIGGSDPDGLFSLQQTSEGGYIFGGYSGSNISGEKTEDRRGGADYWVVKLDRRGKIEWDKTIGGNNEDILYSIKEVVKNHYVLGGESFSKISGDKTNGSRGFNDYWLVELKYIKQDSIAVTTLSNTNSIKVSGNSSNKQFTVYPNPAKDILYIQTNGKATFTLTNQSGKFLLTKTINNKGEINVANLAAGLYYLKNSTTGETQKVLITK